MEYWVGLPSEKVMLLKTPLKAASHRDTEAHRGNLKNRKTVTSHPVKLTARDQNYSPMVIGFNRKSVINLY